jgi:hypothetical protein
LLKAVGGIGRQKNSNEVEYLCCHQMETADLLGTTRRTGARMDVYCVTRSETVQYEGANVIYRMIRVRQRLND